MTIPINYVKMVSEDIAVPITNLINKCIRDSCFPKAWKIARVSPIPKVNNPVVNDQLRPISILPALSKVFEKVVALQIIDYVEQHAVLNDKVTGFRKGHSTITTLIGIKNDIIRAMKKRQITLMVLADYSKAFDTVSLKSMITKMRKLNFSKAFLVLVLNYMSNREQFVKIDDRTSNKMTIDFGIPQGSILGPMFLNLYVADLQENIDQQVTCFQYADDSTFYKHCKYIDLLQCEAEMNTALVQLSDWSYDSNLALNAGKTKCMFFSTQQMASTHSLHLHETSLAVDGKLLERIRVTKLLGLHITENLTWNDHIKQLCSICYSTLVTLRKIKNFTPFYLLKQLAEQLILSKMDYGDLVFNPLPDYLLSRLQKIQFSAASFVTRKYVNSAETLLKLNWLPMRERRDFNLLKATHKAIYSQNWPKYAAVELYKPARSLRSSTSLNLVRPMEKGTFQDISSELFNSLPSDIRSIYDYSQFCTKVRAVLKSRIM